MSEIRGGEDHDNTGRISWLHRVENSLLPEVILFCEVKSIQYEMRPNNDMVMVSSSKK